MTTIKRFTPDYKMHAVRFEAFAREAEHGEFVKFSDYEALVSELVSSRQINAQTLQVKLTMADTIKEQTVRVNALAEENQTLKSGCGFSHTTQTMALRSSKPRMKPLQPLNPTLTTTEARRAMAGLTRLLRCPGG